MSVETHGEEDVMDVCMLCRASGGLAGGPEMFGEVRSHGVHNSSSFSPLLFPIFLLFLLLLFLLL